MKGQSGRGNGTRGASQTWEAFGGWPAVLLGWHPRTVGLEGEAGIWLKTDTGEG